MNVDHVTPGSHITFAACAKIVISHERSAWSPRSLEGRAWSGRAPIASVHVSTNGGATWTAAELEPAPDRWAWSRWTWTWDAEPGDHELACRARDAEGTEQPLEPEWNVGGYANNSVQRVAVTVR